MQSGRTAEAYNSWMVLEYDLEHERGVRMTAFEWLASQVSDGGIVSRETIARGFQYGGRRVQLVGRQGIVTPETHGASTIHKGVAERAVRKRDRSRSDLAISTSWE